MYIIDIIVNNMALDMFASKTLKYTLQANDIAEIKDRQASFSNMYDVPKTAKNVRAMQGLGIASDTSSLPYTKPSCQLRIEGFSFIVKGWMNVKETSDTYKIYIYSGIIEFFKSIENKTLGDIVGTDLDHDKNLETVIASFTNASYRYLIADYNGQTHFDLSGEQVINIDYLVPSARVKYIWTKIHSFSNSIYTGAIFNTEAFTNLWMTYPKSVDAGELLPVASGKGGSQIDFRRHYEGGIGAFDQITFNRDVIGILNSKTFKAAESGRYRFTMSINGYVVNRFAPAANFNSFPMSVRYSINQEDVPLNQRVNTPEVGVATIVRENNSLNFSFNLDMSAGDEISFFRYFSTDQDYYMGTSDTINVDSIISGAGDFSEELKSMSATDFVKEILNQLGLTPYTNEHTNEIRYKTISERLIDAPVLDWSHKYIERTNEAYVHSSYAQKNTFKYVYPDQQSTHNNGSILINNSNLNAEKDVFSSKTYSPERDKTSFYIGSAGNFLSNVYRIYDKDVKENDGVVEITYKSLDKRFHFVRAEEKVTSVKLGSSKFGDAEEVSSIWVANFNRLDWTTIIEDNYTEMGRIMNDSRLHDIDVYIYPTDIILMDLFCLVYFAQEAQYYMINKLSYNGSAKTSGEFVRVKREADPAITFYISITWDDGTKDDKIGMFDVQIVLLASITPPASTPVVTYMWQLDSGAGFVDAGAGVSPKSMDFPSNGSYRIRFKSSSENGSVYYSNILNYQKIGANVYISNVVSDISAGTTSYKLHVENETFVGYANLRVKKYVNTRNVGVRDTYGDKLDIPNSDPASDDEVFKSTSVVIPVGVYDCLVYTLGFPLNPDEFAQFEGGVSYSLTPSYYGFIAATEVYREVYPIG